MTMILTGVSGIIVRDQEHIESAVVTRYPLSAASREAAADYVFGAVRLFVSLCNQFL